jgi:heme/copper-type cytochrome/quinol oxidase subunit 2
MKGRGIFVDLPRRRLRLALAAATLGLLLAGGVGVRLLVADGRDLPPSSRGGSSTQGGDRALGPLEIVLEDGDTVHPKELKVPLGEPVRLVVKNESTAFHDFIVEPLGFHEDVQPGQVSSGWLRPSREGTFRSWCVQAGHGESVTFLVVT